MAQEKLEEITGINAQVKKELEEVLLRNHKIYREQPGRITSYEHTFVVTDTTPYCTKGWPIPLRYQEAVCKEIKKMEECGVIERATNPYINPNVTVIKKDPSVRLCLDARRINAVTVPDYEGAIPINEVLANCGNIKVMSSIGLTSSFWQIPLAEECHDFTGFLCKGRCYRYTVIPFGLKTSLASLTRGLDHVLSEELKRFKIIYVDDCLCVSRSIEEHLVHLRLLLEDLKKANLTVNLRKSKFFREKIEYLGYELLTRGISASSDKVAAILEFPKPKNPKQLQGFLGLTNFYNKFTSRYAEATQPLLQLLKKEVDWTRELDEQFEEVKQLFVNTVKLKHPNHNKRFYLQTDASKYALEGQLYQIYEDNQIGVIAFTSRVFRGAELNYFTTELELLSLVHRLKKFRTYVLGRPLTDITDNKALTFMQKCQLTCSRITRRILAIQEYDFEIMHCKGSENTVADMVSRYPEDSQEDMPRDGDEELEICAVDIKLSKQLKNQLRNISQSQQRDQKLNKIIGTLQNDTLNRLHKIYKWHNNKLYCK